MRVISIIVHLIALCDPALHKTTEEAAHPSLLNKRGVNFALLLSFSFLQLSLEAFYCISSTLRALPTMPRPGMHSICVSLFVFIVPMILSTSLILLSNFSTVSVQSSSLSLVLTAVPLSIPKSRESPCGRAETVCLIPSLREEKNETGQGVGELECLFPNLTPTSPTHGRAESHPLTSLHPIAHLSHFTPSCVQSVAWFVVWSPSPVMTKCGVQDTVNTRSETWCVCDIAQFPSGLFK